LTVSEQTRNALVRYARNVNGGQTDAGIVRMVQQIVATREYQFA